MWAWVPICLLASFDAAGPSPVAARLSGFATIAIEAVGCLLAGVPADRYGRTTIASWSMLISGSCAVVAELAFERPALTLQTSLGFLLTLVSTGGCLLFS